MNAVFLMSQTLRIDVTKCECDEMWSVYDVIRVSSVMTAIIVVMASIDRL